MALIAVTQKIWFSETFSETWDAIDQRWYSFLEKIGLSLILLPNNLCLTEQLMLRQNIDGILLTGGNSLKKYGGDAELRDEVESWLLRYAIMQEIPLIGVCRGMQLIQDYFGIRLKKLTNHVYHDQLIQINGRTELVNSYHNWGTTCNNVEFNIFASSEDGIIKGIHHHQLPITAIMWHPERITPFRQEDISLFRHRFLKISS